MADLKAAMKMSQMGMEAQSQRIRVIAENVANADSVATEAGGEPYRRKTISFKNVLDRELGHNVVVVDQIGVDNSPFGSRYSPNHPMANPQGYVQTPNVTTMIEMADMREAQRSYEANLSAIDITKTMLQRTLDLLR